MRDIANARQIRLEWSAFIASVQRPANQNRIKALMELASIGQVMLKIDWDSISVSSAVDGACWPVVEEESAQ
jgi:hypothetical protein